MTKLLGPVVIIGFLCQSGVGWAEDAQYDVTGGIHYFSGKDSKSLAPNTSNLIRFGAGTGRKSFFRFLSSMSILTGTATANFDDSGTTRALSYQFVGGEFALGPKFSPFGSMGKLPVQPYFGAAGVMQVDSFNFGTQTVSADFPKTEANVFYGYALFVGVDIDIGKSWGFQFHVEQCAMTGIIANTSFNLGGNRVLFGLFFM